MVVDCKAESTAAILNKCSKALCSFLMPGHKEMITIMEYIFFSVILQRIKTKSQGRIWANPHLCTMYQLHLLHVAT